MNVTGMIDLQTCAKVVAESYQEYLLPLGVITIIALFAGMIAAFLYLQEFQEKRLLREFLRKQNMLNKFEDWKKDRGLI
jgi:hypothetical protein